MPFTTAREAVPSAIVSASQSELRLTFPIDLARAGLEPPAAIESRSWGPLKRPNSLLTYTGDIYKGWKAAPSQVFRVARARGREVDVRICNHHAAGKRFRLTDVSVIMFTTSKLAFVVLTVAPPEPEQTTLADWLDIAGEVRFAWTGRAPSLTLIKDHDGEESDCWVQEGATKGQLIDLLSHVCTQVFGSLPQGPDVLRDHYPFLDGQLLVSGTWFAEGVPEAGQEMVSWLVRNQLRADQLVGSEGDPAARRDRIVPYTHGQHFASTLEATSFVAFDAPEHPFFTATLPDHLGNEYFLAWLFALHQRFFLLRQVAELAHEALDEHAKTATERFSAVETHAAALARFEARGYELHLLQREHHHRYWQSVRAALDINELHGYVAGLIERASSRARAQRAEEEAQERERAVEEAATAQKREERRQRQLELLLVFALAVPGILLGTAGINIEGWTAGSDGAAKGTALGLAVLSVVLILIVVVWSGRRRSD